MSKIYKGYEAGKQIFGALKKAFRGGEKQKTTGTEVISSVPIAKNIDTKKAIEQKVVKTVDKAFKDAGAPPSIANKQAKSKLKREEGKKLKDFSYRLDKLQEKIEKKAKGGRVGLKRGTFPDYSGDGKTTMKDILMGRGVIPKPKGKKKMMAKKSETPMDKAIKKKNKNNKRII